MKTRLAEYEKEIANEKSSGRRYRLERLYNSLKSRYEPKKKEYYQIKHAFKKKQRAFEKARSEFRWKSNAAIAATSFKVILKDDTKLTARLVSTSRERDLALLKVDGYKTPAVEAAAPAYLSQGMKVYAIGSPIGLRGAVTSGVITHTKDEYIFTDTQILPGSSGGPLISADGKVIGINTAKVAEYVSAEGFGIAISIDAVSKEFKKTLRDTN